MKLRFLTAGESHGRALVAIVEGLPSGLAITAEEIHVDLRRRKLGYGRGARQKMESDEVELLSGIRHGATLGSPIALLIHNRDWNNWTDIMQAEPFEGEVRRRLEVPRPGHADYIGGIKYAHADMRNVLERASARETTIRVAIAAVARKFLRELGIEIASHVTGVGEHGHTRTPGLSEPGTSPSSLVELNARADQSPLRCLDSELETRMVSSVEAAKKAGDTLGGTFEVLAAGVPLGLGSYVHWDRRLEGKIAQAFLSLNAVKGVEVGLGFEAARVPGSQAHDEFEPATKPQRVHYRSNRSGGIDGGMTTGQTLVVRGAMKPLATLMSALPSVRLTTGQPESAHVERSDVCAVPSAAVIGESLLSLVLAEAILEKFGGDSMAEIKERVASWKRLSDSEG